MSIKEEGLADGLGHYKRRIWNAQKITGKIKKITKAKTEVVVDEEVSYCNGLSFDRDSSMDSVTGMKVSQRDADKVH